MGCISDGRSWQFYYLRRATFGRRKDRISGYELFVYKDILARSKEEIVFVFGTSLIILSDFRHLVAFGGAI